MTLCNKGGGDPKFCDITFQKWYYGDITRINQIETIPLKSIEQLNQYTFNVHLAQFDVTPTGNLIISRCEIAKKCDVTLGGGG